MDFELDFLEEEKEQLPVTTGDEHCTLAPSDASRWRKCHAALWLTKDDPDTTNASAERGTECHAVAAYCLNKNVDVEDGAEYTVLIDGAERKVTLDDEQYGYVSDYVARMNAHRKADWFAFEYRLDLSKVYGVEGQFGTADAIAYYKNIRRICVEDLKTGRTYVPEEDNSQLEIYAAGALLLIEEKFGTDAVREICIGIHQPLHGAPRHHILEVQELRAKMVSIKADALCAWRILNRDVPPNANYFVVDPDNQCMYCAKEKCKAYLTAQQELYGADFKDVTSIAKVEQTVHIVTPDKLGKWFLALPALEQFIKTIRSTVEAQVLSGMYIPGVKAVRGRNGARKWRDPVEAEEVVKSMKLLQAEMYDITLKSPTQITKFLEKEGSKRKLKRLMEFIEIPEGKITIAPESDPREPVLIGDAASDFEDVSENWI